MGLFMRLLDDFSLILRRDKCLNRRVARRSARRSGQALVETALVLSTVLIPLTVGILQFGIVLNATNTLTQIAREGGRYAAVRHTDAEIRAYVKQVATGTSIRPADLTDARIAIAMVPSTATRTAGNPIQVTITYPMANKIFIGNFLPGILKLRNDYVAQSTFVLE